LKLSTCLVRCLSASILCAVLIPPQCALADAHPVGFAKGVTGGGNAFIVRPATPDELKTALCATYDTRGQCTDDTPRVIALDHMFDFRGSVITDGSAQVTEAGCMANACPHGGGQWAINGANHFCQSRPPATVTYDKAGLQRLKIGSNKTLIGLGSHAGIQGMGLFVGGDALTLDDADGVWIDHDTFVRIGRQMVVTGWGSATHVTLSNNEFDGRTPYSATCDGHHYWVWLFLGHHDTLTLVGNYVHDTSGRAPHSGGMGDADVRAQLVNNLFAHLSYQGAIMSRTATSHLLVEGNAFEDVSHPLFNDTRQPGTAFAPFAQAAGDACRVAIGRPCVANQQHLSGDDYRLQDVPALAAFSAYREYLITPQPAEIALAQVPANAGAGHLNAGKI